MELAKESTRSHGPIVLMAVVLSAPVLAFPDTGVWHGMRPFLIQAMAFGSLALMLARVRWSVEGLRSFLTTGPNLALVLFLGWTALSFALTAPVSGRGRAIALAELMRLASGVAIYFAVVYRCNSRKHLKAAVLLLVVGGVLASAAGMLSAGVSKSGSVAAAYGNKQLLAAFLVLLLPVAVVFAQTGEKFSRPLFATTAALRCLLATVGTVMLVAALLLTNNRSSWLGSVVGLLVVTVLLFRTRKHREATTRKQWIASAVVALASVALFFTLLGTESGVLERAKTLTAPTQVSSFQQRLQLWSICEQMIRDRPLMGLGVGSFPIKAGDYSGAMSDRKDEQTVLASGVETMGVPSAAQVEQEGASMSSLPHNEYLQLAAEQGLVGLALYVAVLVGFFYRGIRTLPHIAKIGRTRKLMLIAAMGAIAAQCVDAIGNPGWRFGDVSPLFWLMLGLGMAATQRQRQERVTEDLAQTPRLLRLGFDRPGRQAAAVLVLALVVPSLAGAQAGSPESSYTVITLVPGVVSVGALVVGIPVLSGRSEPKTESDAEVTPESLDISGPVFPAIMNMSNFSVVGFVKGGWPIVIEYELESDSTAVATISTRDGKHSFPITLLSTNDQPREIMSQIPADFGQEPVVGVLSFIALKNGPEPKKPARFFLSGLGLGPHGVGSMVIDRLQCQPGSIHPKLKEEARYSFHSFYDFPKVTADFRLPTYVSRKVGFSGRVVFSERLPNGIRQDGFAQDVWNGKNNKGEIEPGSYQFWVLVWQVESNKDWAHRAKEHAVKVE